MSSDEPRKFVVTMTADFFDAGGTPKYRDLGSSVFDAHPHIETRVFAEHRPKIGPDQIGDAQGVIVLTPAVTAESVCRAENLLAIGRFGVGYDAVNVPACTEADVVVFIAAGAVDRSVAEATVGWMIALAHHVRIKDRLVRTGQERLNHRAKTVFGHFHRGAGFFKRVRHVAKVFHVRPEKNRLGEKSRFNRIVAAYRHQRPADKHYLC